VDPVRQLLRDLGPPVHVLAFSMGGHASLALAATDPELFASLVLVGVSVREHQGLDGWRSKFDPDNLEAEFPLWARQLWPHADELVVPGGGHDVQLTRARLVGPALVDFLDRAKRNP